MAFRDRLLVKDEQEGIKRFKANRIVKALMKRIEAEAAYILNDITINQQNGIYTLDELKEFYQLIGTSWQLYVDTFGSEDVGEAGGADDPEAEKPSLEALLKEVQGMRRELASLRKHLGMIAHE